MIKTKAICITAAGITALAFLLNRIDKNKLGSALEDARQAAEAIEQKTKTIRSAQEALLSNTKTLSEYNAWRNGRDQPVYSIFESVSENTPPQTAVYHLIVSTEQNSINEPITRSLYISGVASGILSAVEVKRQFNRDSQLRRFCGEIKLASAKRYSTNSWAFALEGSFTVKNNTP